MHYCVIRYNILAFQIWQCEFIAEIKNPHGITVYKVKFIKPVFRWKDTSELFDRVKPEAVMNVSVIYDNYQAALLEAKQHFTEQINTDDAHIKHEAQWHLEEYLRYSSSTFLADRMRDLYNYDEIARWDYSWKTQVFRYCHVGNKELCLIGGCVEDMPAAVWENDVLVWNYLGLSQYFYKTQELALTAFNNALK